MLRAPLLWILFLLIAFPVQGQEPRPGPAPDVARYRNSLLPGDVIRVQIWREEDLSGEFVVDEDGVVTLPLLGARAVLGISAEALRDQLVEGYAVYLQNPSVNVTLLRRVAVLGEVRVPGVYTVDATVSIADLIARAQGLNPDGNADDITLLREGQQFRGTLTGATLIGEAGIRSGDRVLVGKRSWFSRNFNSMVGIVSILTNVILITTR